MKKLFLLLISLFVGCQFLFAQEFMCTVQVNADQVQTSDRRVFETLQNAIYEFINNRKWSSYSFKIEERIECSILLTISERSSADEFKGTLNVQLSRPIYGSSYNSVLLNYMDKDIQFKYIEYEPLDFTDNTFTSNLTSLLAYYSYIMLGFDFDSYSLLGGTLFYEKAQAVVNTAQNASASGTGWKSYESMKNRYWLAENSLNSIYRPIRESIYKYHRLGLDVMADKPDDGREAVYQSIEALELVHKDKPGSFLMQLFFDAKRDELINVFSQGTPVEKTKAINILSEIDPANASRYQKIMSK